MKMLLAVICGTGLGMGGLQLEAQDTVAATPPAASSLALEIQRAVTTADTTISLASLGRILTPLRRRQVAVEAEAWMELVETAATDVPQADGDQARLASLDGLLERAYRVVDELERKGGYVAEYTAYLDAVSGREEVESWLEQLAGSSRFLRWFLFFVVLLCAVSLLLGFSWFLGRQYQNDPRGHFRRPAWMVAATGVLMIVVVLVLPVSEGTRGDLLGLVGLGMTAVIALSSTTLVANAMSGLILRSVRNFELGDWLRVGEQFGRVTQLGLFHTEIQTEESDLTALPNSYLISHPVKVVRRERTGRGGVSGGTFLTVTLSLGYDNSVAEIHKYLKQAAETTSVNPNDTPGQEIRFENCYVDILDLGDFSVTYRVRGFLKQVKYLLDMRSALRRMIVQTLHEHRVEIVSPAFMNQRRLAVDEKVIPEVDKVRTDAVATVTETLPSELQFPDAEMAESKEELVQRRADLVEEIKALEAELAGTPEEEDSHTTGRKNLEHLQRERDAITGRLETLEP